jgi:hypothetical protein
VRHRRYARRWLLPVHAGRRPDGHALGIRVDEFVVADDVVRGGDAAHASFGTKRPGAVLPVPRRSADAGHAVHDHHHGHAGQGLIAEHALYDDDNAHRRARGDSHTSPTTHHRPRLLPIHQYLFSYPTRLDALHQLYSTLFAIDICDAAIKHSIIRTVMWSFF